MGLLDFFVYKTDGNKLTRYVGRKKQIVLPDFIEQIGPNVFFKSGVLSIDINNVKKFSKYAFCNTKFVEEIKLNTNITEITEGCFEACFSLKKIEIPDTVVSIGKHAFDRCAELEKLDIPETVFKIGSYAFEGSGLTSAYISPSVTSYGIGLFKSCKNLKEVTFDCFMDDIYDDMFWGCTNLTSITIPKGIKRIGNNTFRDCSKLEDFSIESSVKEIGAYALAGTLLSKIDLTNVEEIGKGAFSNCENLEDVIFGDKLKIIPESAFEGSTLFAARFNENITHIDANAFNDCEFLETLTFLNPDVNIHYTAFTNCENLSTIYYKGEKLDVSNITLEYIDTSVLEYLYKHRNILDKIKGPMTLKTMQAMENAGVLNEFVSSATFKYYKQILSEFQKHKSASEEGLVDNLFLFCYTLGVFDKDLCQKSGEILKDLTKRNRVRPNNITSLVYEVKYKPIDREMIKEITDLKGIFIKELMEKTGEYPKVIGLSLSRYNEVQQHNTSENAKHRQLRPTAQKFIDYFNVDKFSNVESKEDEDIAKEIGKFYSRQYVYDTAKAVMERFHRDGVPRSLISEEYRKEEIESVKEEIRDTFEKLDTKLNKIYYEFLLKDDARNLTAGRYCSDCCGHIEGMGEDIAFGSILNPHTQTLVMKDKHGEIVSKAVFYVNSDNEVIINGIYLNDDVSSGKEEMFAKKYLEAFEIFMNDYNSLHDNKIERVYLSVKSPLITEFYYKGELKPPVNVVDYSIYHMDRDLAYEGDCNDGVVCIINKPQNITVNSRKR